MISHARFICVCSLVITAGALADSTRQLSQDEIAELTQSAAQFRSFGAEPVVIDGAIHEYDDGTVTGEADVTFQPSRVGRNGCIAAHVIFHGDSNATKKLGWDRAPVNATFDYWPDRENCSDRTSTGSIHLQHLIDSDTVARLLGSAREIFALASNKLQRLQDRTGSGTADIVSIGLSLEPDVGYVYEIRFWDGTCSGGMSVLLRLRESDFEIINATQIVC